MIEAEELYWKIATEAAFMLKMAVWGYFFYLLVKPFMQRREKAYFAGVGYTASLVFLYWIPLQIPNMLVYGIAMITAFLILCSVDRRNYQQKLFLSVTFFTLRWLSAYIRSMLTLGINEQFIQIDALKVSSTYLLFLYIGIELLELVLDMVILRIIIWYILKTYRNKTEIMTTKEMFMMTAPSAAGLAGYGMIQYFQNHYDISVIAENDSAYRIMEFFYYVISLATILVVIVLFQKIKANKEEEIQRELLVTQMESLHHHIEQAEKLYQNMRSMKHDMVNHIQTLERLSNRQELEAARQYAESLQKTWKETTKEMQSGNPVTDVILADWSEEAKKKGIQFTCDFHYPAALPAENLQKKDLAADIDSVDAFDISIILHNALENAIMAAADTKAPFVTVSSYQNKNVFMIEIKNRFSGTITWNLENGLPYTSKQKMKKDTEQVHGYGLANIRRVAQKYEGDIDITAEDGVFCLNVMLLCKNVKV